MLQCVCPPRLLGSDYQLLVYSYHYHWNIARWHCTLMSSKCFEQHRGTGRSHGFQNRPFPRHGGLDSCCPIDYRPSQTPRHAGGDHEAGVRLADKGDESGERQKEEELDTEHSYGEGDTF